MGKQLVVNALVQYDKRQLKCDILINETIARLKVESSSSNSNKTKENVKNDLKETEQQIIANWIKNATSTEYAAFAPLIFEYATRSEIAKNIITDASYWIEDLAKTAGFKTEEHADIPIAIIGGLAQAIKPFLSNDLSDALVSPAGNSLDGALYLGEKHLSENFLERPTTTN
jgi:N-acetylglucosamine kinase-like BadF-type ATPase